jgi:hypothetical protein
MPASQLLACQQRCAATAAVRAIAAIALLLQQHLIFLCRARPCTAQGLMPLAQNLLKAFHKTEGRHRQQAGSYRGFVWFTRSADQLSEVPQ